MTYICPHILPIHTCHVPSQVVTSLSMAGAVGYLVIAGLSKYPPALQGYLVHKKPHPPRTLQ